MKISTIEEFENFAKQFQNCTLAKNQWTHEAHFTIGLWLILKFGIENARSLAREGIKKYNEATGVANTESNGYHETITMMYLTLIDNFRKEHNSNDELDLLAALLKSEMIYREYLLKFYSPKVLFSKEARSSYIKPDLSAIKP